MSDDLQTLLRPLREVEPTSDELARLRAAIQDRPAPAVRRGFRLPPIGRRRLAVLAATSLAIAVGVAALPGGEDDSLRGALRAAAAAAAEAPPGGAPFTGYRHIVERVRFDMPGAKPRKFLRELWIDAKFGGVERIDEGDGARPETTPLSERDGPFGKAPLADCRPILMRCCASSRPPRLTAASRSPAGAEPGAEARPGRPPS